MATDARGHTIPTGNDFAARKSLTDLSLSVPSLKCLNSESAATLHLSTLANAGITPSAVSPVYVWRSDLQDIMVHDGAGWQYADPYRSVAAVQSSAMSPIPANGWQQVVLNFPDISGRFMDGYGISPLLTISGDMDCASRLIAISETVGYTSISIRVRNVTSAAGVGTWRVHAAIIRRRS